ncbi:MAG TPA: hypothetical protein VF211_07710 [Burkholderiales bacterium]
MRATLSFVLLAFAWIQAACAAPFAVRIGEMRIALDAPPGFSDTQFTGSPRLNDIAASLTSASNRILLFALEDADLRRFTLGDPIELRRYLLIATPRAMEMQSLSLNAFAALVAASLPQEGGPGAAPQDLKAYFDAQPPGRLNAIGTLKSDPERASMLFGTRLPPSRDEEPTRYLVSSRTLLLMRGKPLDILVFSRYERPADLEWVRGATERWIEELRRLNSR